MEVYRNGWMCVFRARKAQLYNLKFSIVLKCMFNPFQSEFLITWCPYQMSPKVLPYSSPFRVICDDSLGLNFSETLPNFRIKNNNKYFRFKFYMQLFTEQQLLILLLLVYYFPQGLSIFIIHLGLSLVL